MNLPSDDALVPQNFPILHVLPLMVARALRRHFYAGVKMAEIRFSYHEADEDAVTGALGERLIEPEITMNFDGRVYRWRTEYYKLRGRGPHAPEKETGADGIFQFDVQDEDGRFVVRKGMLFQSKIGWTGRDARLVEQARRLAEASPSAIVIDYSSSGYTAISAKGVISAEGNRKMVDPEDDESLAEVLGDEFVGCLRGDPGLYWEPKTERIIVNNERALEFVPEHFIGTTLQRLQ